MQHIISQIKIIKDNLNQTRREPRFIKEGRDFAFSLLKEKKFTKEQLAALEMLLGKEEKLSEPLEISAGEVVSIDSAAGNIDMNFLEYTELEKNLEFFSNYIFHNISQDSDIMVLANLAVFSSGGLVLVSAEHETRHFFMHYHQSAPLGFVVAWVVESGVAAQITVSSGAEPKELPMSFGLDRVFVGEGVALEISNFYNECQAKSFFTREIFLEANASCRVWGASFNCPAARIFNQAYLAGEKAEYSYRGLYRAGGTDEISIIANAHHMAERSTSDIVVKGTLDGSAFIDFVGDLELSKDAKLSNAHLVESGLQLSASAKKRSLPILRVHTNDVGAKHGSSTTQLDADRLFYLQSRGLERDEARSVLIGGFLGEIIDACPNEDVRELLQNKLRITNDELRIRQIHVPSPSSPRAP
ncbi:MAG: Fe-S cluster assembly protein SufD [Parcubacteria group bacterium Gr01-1014_18]|nr:MAG: Fe-S cluster assembly protein SufD [Parcubacteria group bacterium Greene0416_36]TSC80707.1 MAG: Fe-S cluster assembly protein SufD [Parcubacteria group bacterium Gr01-1014_18]TSC98682.1 MAG: Fe-S cluster assembly protein SufD [Parcubacteria group bacterium Greene1014_20]TSD07158.1 MAG: Fe-S cluster assembly protein SufD [Parcubacteria group bacterium Greene0714_2]